MHGGLKNFAEVHLFWVYLLGDLRGLNHHILLSAKDMKRSVLVKVRAADDNYVSYISTANHHEHHVQFTTPSSHQIFPVSVLVTPPP